MRGASGKISIGWPLISCNQEILLSPRVNLQSELNFNEDGGNEGYTRWLVGRQVATEILARKMGLPLGHEVEVWLIGGMRLRGRLRL